MMYKLPTYLQVSLATVVVAFVIFPRQADADLKHRYSFNEGATTDASGRTITDSVSGRNGTVVGAEATATAGELTLPGGPSATQAYVDLPNGIVSSLTDATFEAWYTMTTAQNWGRIFDFGSTGTGGMNGVELTEPGGGGEGLDNIFFSASRGTNGNQQRTGVRNNDPLFGPSGQAGTVSGTEMPTLDTNIPYTLNTQRHVAVVFDSDGGTQPGMASVATYLDGVLVANAPTATAPTNPADTPLALNNLNDVNNWLGRSNWTGDANFGGSFNEFRIYDHALNADDVGKSFFFGPDEAITGDVLSVEVNTSSGQVTLVNELNRAVNFDYYEIKSTGGALNTAGWNSLDDKEGADPPGQGWDESGGASPNQLIELFLGDTPFSIPANGSLALGNAFNVGGANDLAFRFGLSDGGGLFLPGSVEYITGPGGVAGDYNGNGVVDAADYVLWRNGGPLQNDPTEGVQTADFDFWRSRFGATSGAGSGLATSVPEPAILAPLMCWVFTFGSWLRFGKHHRS
jgi:hypothetical protein